MQDAEGLTLCQVVSTRFHRPIALHGRLAFPFAQLIINPVCQAQASAGVALGSSVEPRDYRATAGLAGGGKRSDGDSATKADTDQAEARAGSKDGFDCLS